MFLHNHEPHEFMILFFSLSDDAVINGGWVRGGVNLLI